MANFRADSAQTCPIRCRHNCGLQDYPRRVHPAAHKPAPDVELSAPELRQNSALRIPVAEIVSALSFALDLTEDAVPGHAIRSCLLGMRMARELQLSEDECGSLFYALLLKDIGCSSNAARLCQVMGDADERRVKSAVKFEDWTKPTWSGVKMAWQTMRPDADPLTRFATLLKLGANQKTNNREMITLRCDRGASIIRRIGLPESTSKAVRHLDEHWEGSGYPEMLRGNDIPILSRILLVAQHLDVFFCGRGAEEAIRSLQEREGRWFDPEVVRAATALDRNGTLWSHMASDVARSTVLDLEPGGRLVARDEQIDDICEAFADVVDVKSSFTGAHSRGVTAAAVRIADVMGFSAERRRFLYRASLLHDLGKLRVPNSILDKPGKLDAEEWKVIQEHPALTRDILLRVGAFEEMAIVAGQHHEKLDGSGYPDRLSADDLSIEARLIAVADVYGALAEDRPYRPGLPMETIRSIMDREAGPKLDRTCYDALLAALEQESESGNIPAPDCATVGTLLPTGHAVPV